MKALMLSTALLAATMATPVKAESSKEDLAIRLVAMAAFVDTSCAGISPDYQMLNVSLEAIGVDIDVLKKNRARMMQGELIIRSFAKAVKTNCTQAVEMFGSNGTILPGIIKVSR